ncbi:MAG TPA: hypothetical protein VJA94_21545 [Candidatus Angelobacter sp.]
MKNAAEDFASVAERLTVRIDELELRLSALEHQRAAVPAPPLPHSPALVESHPLAQLSAAQSPGALPAVGRLFLGIAGGYLLREVAESGALPQLTIVVLSIVYAAGWLIWGARMPSEARFTSAVYAATGTLIFAPMVWETTFRFKVLPHAVSAGVLAGFVLLAMALEWKRKLASVAWIATSLPAVTALMLLVRTRDPAPFALALLVIALLTEYAGLRGRWRSLRPMVALLADAAILVLILVYAGQSQLPPEYPPLRPALLLALASSLFVIYGCVIVLSTVVKQQTVTAFEVAQAVIALALAFVNAMRMSHDAAALPLGIFSLLLAGACYVAVLGRFDRVLQPRNYHVFATWGGALALLGSFLCFEATGMVLGLGVLAIAASFAAVRYGHWTLGFHAVVYGVVAGYFSGLLAYAAWALAGPLPEAPGWSAWTTAIAALICCAISWWPAPEGSARQARATLRLLFSSLTILVAAALAVIAILWMISSGSALTAPRVAVARTVVLCAVILALSFTANRWNRFELMWIRNAVIALWTLKLLYEDLHYGTAGSIAISLFLYGTIWVLMPRMVRKQIVNSK